MKGLQKQAAIAMATVHNYVDKSTLIIVVTDVLYGCALWAFAVKFLHISLATLSQAPNNLIYEYEGTYCKYTLRSAEQRMKLHQSTTKEEHQGLDYSEPINTLSLTTWFDYKVEINWWQEFQHIIVGV